MEESERSFSWAYCFGAVAQGNDEAASTRTSGEILLRSSWELDREGTGTVVENSKRRNQSEIVGIQLVEWLRLLLRTATLVDYQGSSLELVPELL